MQKKRPLTAYIFTVLIAVAAAIIAYYSLHQMKIYSGNSAYLKDIITGRDLITLFICAPLLLITGFMALRESSRAYLAWLGLLSYFLYTYLWYAGGIAYNKFYLVYVAIFALSLFSLISVLVAMDVEIFSLRFSPKTPINVTAVFLLVSGFILAYQCLHPLLPGFNTGKQPDLLQLYGSTAMIQQVLNLGLISTLAMITSLWIWKRKPWGYIITSILLLYGFTTGLAFLATQWVIYHRGQRIDLDSTIIFSGVTLFIFILWIIFLKNLREETIQDYHSRISSIT
jgi:hypothetical protein